MRTYQQLNSELGSIDTLILNARSQLAILESRKRHVEYQMFTYDAKRTATIEDATANVDTEWADLIQALT